MHPQVEKFLSESQRRFFEKGLTEGLAEGLAASRASVLEVLEVRGIEVSEPQRERILGCTELETLARWHRRAVTVDSTDDLFV